jgi:hypothetical protein
MLAGQHHTSGNVAALGSKLCDASENYVVNHSSVNFVALHQLQNAVKKNRGGFFTNKTLSDLSSKKPMRNSREKNQSNLINYDSTEVSRVPLGQGSSLLSSRCANTIYNVSLHVRERTKNNALVRQSHSEFRATFASVKGRKKVER